ncbi:MAG: hypothetical protein CM15mV141_070 [uncultured marine virus]|nr:MAG: hypothetical protein CM15mV141_070 [uncultured marine virus]
MMKLAQDEASERAELNTDVTMGSNKPVLLVEDLIDEKGFEAAEVMFIMYSKEQAADSVIDRYIRKNFTTANNRGGRYVVSDVIEGQLKD